MAERDKIIKSGQFTLPRLGFLALIGLLLWGIVYFGGVFLHIGYWVLTLAICVLLYLIAIDYRVKMEKVELATESGHPDALVEPTSGSAVEVKTTMGGPRPKRRTSRPAKRRR